MVNLSPAFNPAVLQGIVIHPNDPLKFDFLVNKGEVLLNDEQKSVEYTKLIKYFLAALTIPDHDQWVNLSPYEKDRIITDDFGKTEMGRDLLGQDYILKQITSSLMYPESGIGKNFWDKVYAKAQEQFSNINISLNMFNKVWIVPDQVLVYEAGNTAFVQSSHLRVMLEQDYVATQHNHSGERSPKGAVEPKNQGTNSTTNRIIREVILPELEREVNQGKNFAQLRQVFSGMILATWYKRALKESLLGKVYADKAKVKGVDQPACRQAGIHCVDNDAIYQQYLDAFKKGVYNYIKEDTDKLTHQPIPRKYFAGGVMNNLAMVVQYKALGDTTISENIYSLDDIVAELAAPDKDPPMLEVQVAKEILVSVKSALAKGDLVSVEKIFQQHSRENKIEVKVLLDAIQGLYWGKIEDHMISVMRKDGLTVSLGHMIINALKGPIPFMNGWHAVFNKEFKMRQRSNDEIRSKAEIDWQVGRKKIIAQIVVSESDAAMVGRVYGVKVEPLEEAAQSLINILDQHPWVPGKDSFSVDRLKKDIARILTDKSRDSMDFLIVHLLIDLNQRSRNGDVNKVIFSTLYADLEKRFFPFGLNLKGDQDDNLEPAVADAAQAADPYGGIDMNAANMSMLIKRDGKGMVLPVSKQDMAQLSRIEGFSPHIILIRPASEMPKHP